MLNVSEVNPECSQEPLAETASVRFSEMLISPYVKERLAAARFTTPTPVQAAAIPQALEGKDVLATAQTGTGKTLAFLIPVIEKLLKDKTPGIAALVLVPTRELAMQVVDQFNKLRGNQLLPAALVVGGLSEGAQLQAIRKGARLVVATPGRLEDYLDRRLFHFNALRILILDEADRMLDMGFLPAIKRIVSILPKERQTMCFSATMEGDMARIVKNYLRNAVRLSFGSTSKPSENVRVQAFEVATDRKQEMLQRLLTREKGKCLVFARTTRGIHVQDIAHVINYDLPEVAENFIHRVGRTGRNGGHGVASTLFVKEQRSELFQLERSLGIKMERLRADETASIPQNQERLPVNLPRVESLQKPARFVLPGEVFQTQLEN